MKPVYVILVDTDLFHGATFEKADAEQRLKELGGDAVMVETTGEVDDEGNLKLYGFELINKEEEKNETDV